MLLLGTGVLGEEALNGQAARDALATTGLSGLLLVVREGARPSGLAGAPVEAVRTDWDGLETAFRAAQASRAGRLVLAPPALLGLSAACREIHALARGRPGLAFALATPDEGALAEPETLALLYEDLAGLRLGYWHRPSRAHLLGHGDAPWLDAVGRHLVGMSLDDVADGKAGLPPGLGTLDLRPAIEARSPGLSVALDVDPVGDVALLRLTIEQLAIAGLS